MTVPNNSLTTMDDRPLTAAEVRAQVNLIQEVMRSVMQDGQHYGKIPGCGDKPALLKPGAEKILATFRIAADPQVEDLSTQDCARYRVICRGISSSGMFLGAGVGEASSDEEKYKWRAMICQEEFDTTPEDRRRIKFFRDGRKVLQIRTNSADVANTVLKMAKKRSQVDMALTVTAASDIFSQDIEEEDIQEQVSQHQEKPPIQPPQRKSNGNAAPKASLGNAVQVTKLSTKSGTTNGRNWTAFFADFSDGTSAGTFDSKMGEMLDEAHMNGSAVIIATEPNAKQPGKFNLTEIAFASREPGQEG